MTARRGTTNRNRRGGNADRARRRQYLVDVHGDGEFVDCALRAVPDCWVAMTVHTVWVDRILPGALDGTYARDNIRAACGPCQMHTGGKLGAARRAQKKLEAASMLALRDGYLDVVE